MKKINERIPTRISPDILDTIGKSFKFNHGKGVAEWLKNSLDNYLRLFDEGEESLSGNWPVFINLIDAKSQSKGPNLALIDFGGTILSDIESFFLHWGDTSAATLGGKSKTSTVTGGHGNGGKFYMREMWRGGARFLTWKKGKATSLVVDKATDGTTGEWEFKNTTISWEKALAQALNKENALQGEDWVVSYIRENFSSLGTELDEQKRGFTIIVGMKAKQILSSNDVVRGGRWINQKIVDDMRGAQQARRPLRELNISLFTNGQLSLERLSLEDIPVDEDWENDEILLPKNVVSFENLSEEEAELGYLSIRKSTQQLTGRYRYHNIIVVSDSDNNPIAFYPISELPLPGHSPLSNFIYGDLKLSFSKIKEYVSNERERLISSDITEAILNWVGNEIWKRIKKYEEIQKAGQKKEELEIADILNDALNNHAKRFLKELETEILIDFIEDEAGGGAGEEGEGTATRGDGTTKDKTPRDWGSGGGEGDGGTGTTPGDSKKKRRPKFPQILLSSHHPDPSREDGLSKELTIRHPPDHQDDIDKRYNIWWINTNHPYSKAALAKGGAKGHAFKNYHLFIFVQVVQLESLRLLQRRQAELGLDVIENELSDVSNKFLGELPMDIVDSLLN